MEGSTLTYAILGLAAYGVFGNPGVSVSSISQPKNGQIIKVFNYPYNLTVKGYSATTMSLQLFEGNNLIDSANMGAGNFTASLQVHGPGPHSIRWTGNDTTGHMLTGTISFTIQTQVVNDLSDAIGVNINACVNFDPVLGKAEAASVVAPDLNFVKTWVDRLDRDGIKYVRLTVAWESMFKGANVPDAQKQANVLQQIVNWCDYCREKQIYIYPTFMTFPHHGMPSTSAASSTNLYARGFPKYTVQPFLPSNATNDKAFFDFVYSNVALWDAIWNTFWKPILERIDSNEFVLGYELCNEPPIWSVQQRDGLGNFHTYLAEKIRTQSSKWIMYVNGFPQGGVGGTLGAFNEVIAPRVDSFVFCPHNYAGTAVTGWQQRFTDRMNAFKATQTALGCPVIVDEFGIGLVGADISILTQANMDHIFRELKRCGFGGMCWVYWPGSDPLHRMVTSTGALTANYGQFYVNSRRDVFGQ